MTSINKIQQYLTKTKQLDSFATSLIIDSYNNHTDIIEEFASVIETGKFPENGITSGDWTAKSLHEALPHLPDYTIYEFLAGLRDYPEEYEKYVAEGAPIL